MATKAFDNLMAGLNTPPLGASKSDELLFGVTPGSLFDIADLALPYKPYQREALEHLFSRGAPEPYAMIGLDMGLGKTPVGIGIAATAKAAGIRPTLIVVPPSLRMNWQRELLKFAPWLSYAVLNGTKVPKGFELPDVDVLLIGDSSLRNDPEGWVPFLVGRFGALVVDESHRFKNKSQRSASLVKLATAVEVKVNKYGRKERVPMLTVDGVPAKPPVIRAPMTGTPAPNGRNTELVNQIDILGDLAWRDIGGKGHFWNYYAPEADSWGGRASSHAEELNAAMKQSWFFRRLRDEVEDLPNKGRSAVSIEAMGRAVKEYKHAEQDLIDFLAGKQDGKVSEGQIRAEALIRLNVLRRLAGEAKVKGIVAHATEILEEEPGGVFIVAEHGATIDGLMKGLAKYNPVAIRGSMTDKDKDAAVQAFTSGESRVMVGQITAAGVGFTLHGGGRNRRVIVAQLPWTPSDLRQAEDRLHRLGQTRDVLVEITLAAIDGKWTIDERLWGILETKNFDTNALIDGGGESLLTEDIQGGVLDTYR